MNEAEREAVVTMVAANPVAGDLVPGNGGLRKLRISLESWSKHGRWQGWRKIWRWILEADMKKVHFDSLMQSVDEARRFARGEAVSGLVVHSRKVDRNEVAAVRIKAGLTQGEFAKMLGASLGTLRKWEMGERSPSGAAATLLRVLDFDATVVTRALGIVPGQPKRTPRSQLVPGE